MQILKWIWSDDTFAEQLLYGNYFGWLDRVLSVAIPYPPRLQGLGHPRHCFNEMRKYHDLLSAGRGTDSII